MVQRRYSLVKSFADAIKSLIPFSGWGGTGGAFGSSQVGYNQDDNFLRNVASWYQRYTGTDIDYGREVGDLLNSSLVMAAANWVARCLPEAKLQVVTLDAEGKEVPVPNHPALAILNRPNKYFSASTLWKAFAISWIIDGNAYLLKARDNYGKLRELWYAPSFMLEPRWPLDGSEFISRYEYNVDGRIVPFAPDDVLHFRNGVNPYNMRLGLSSCASVLREIYSDSQAMNYQAALLAHGAVPPAVLSVKTNADGFGGGVQADTEELKAKYTQATQGDQRGKVFVSNLPVELTKIAFNPSEMDLKSLRAMPEERFASVLGIPAIVLGFGAGLAASTYNNTQQADERAYETFMIPLWRFLEEELTTQLMPEFDTSGKLMFRFDLRTVRALSLDEDALYKRLSTAYKFDWLKRSEARAQAGLKVGPEDEVYYSEVVAQQKAAEAEKQYQIAVAQAAATPKQDQNGQQQPRQQRKIQLQGDNGQTKAAFSIAMITPSPSERAAILKSAGNFFTPDAWESPENGIVEDPHVTIKYGLHTDDPELVRKAVEGFGAITVEVSASKQMIAGSGGFVAYYPVKSARMVQLFQTIADATSHQETFAEYLPHISLCWLNSDAFHSEKFVGLEAPFKSFTVDEIVFSDRAGNETLISLTETLDTTGLDVKRLPGKTEIQAATEYWQTIAPDIAMELINAKQQ